MSNSNAHTALVEPSGPQWAVTVEGFGERRVDDPRHADRCAREMLAEHLEIESWTERDALDVCLVDPAGRQVFGFVVLFNSYRPDPLPQSAYEKVAADPPPGCRFRYFGAYPGLCCLRPGGSRLLAIAELVRHLRVRYGLPDANDLGMERLWEWYATDRQHSHDLVAHLLLMASHRAELSGLAPDELTGFLRSAGERVAG